MNAHCDEVMSVGSSPVTCGGGRHVRARPDEGFTLIEMLIVIVVLGVLAAMVVFDLGGVTTSATQSACRADVTTVETAISSYNAETGGRPIVTEASLTQGPSPYLQSWPANSGYSLTITGGLLYVQTASDAAPVLASSSGACNTAGATSTSTTAPMALQPAGTDTSVSGGNTGTLQGGATAILTGPLGAGSLSLPGTTGYVETTKHISSPSTFSISAWFESTTSGPLIGFTNSQAAVPTGQYDRMVWLDPAGHVVFGVWMNSAAEVSSPLTYFGGGWHSVVATWSSTSPSEQRLYVDGALVAQAAVSSAYVYQGYWHLGFAYSVNWPHPPSSNFFRGGLAYVGVFPTALTATQVTSLAGAGSFSAESRAALALGPTYFWPLDGGAG